MFAPNRDEVRALFYETWRKYGAGLALEGVEAIALQAILLHPEYHAVLADPERTRARDYFPELGETNPFLHLSLHVALEEQRSIDQPAGVRAAIDALTRCCADRHAALHEAIECLAEMVWRAQREGAPPDGDAYLRCLASRALT
ncbi:MAG TPA: DUF1841 family protein [Burkholderiales bacterium]